MRASGSNNIACKQNTQNKFGNLQKIIDDWKFAIYRFTTVYFAGLKQNIYSAYRVKLCENVCWLPAGEPIKCARSLPFGICDRQAEHLSLSHIGSFRV